MSSGYEPLLSHYYPACNVTQHNVTTEGAVLVQFQTLHQINIKKKVHGCNPNLVAQYNCCSLSYVHCLNITAD